MKRIILIVTVIIFIFSFGCTDPAPEPGDGSITEPGNNGSVEGVITVPGLNDLSGCLVVVERQIGNATSTLVKEITGERDATIVVNNLKSAGLIDESLDTRIASGDVGIFTGMTDRDGVYAVSVPEGVYTVTITKQHTLGAYQRNVVVLSRAPTVVDIVLTATGSVSGTATLDGTTVNIPGTFIYAEGTSYVAGSAFDGSFTISDIPVGTYDMVFYHDGYEPREMTGVVVTAAENTVLGNVDLHYIGNYPVINTMTANPFVVEPGFPSLITANVYDQDGDPLTCTWTALEGILSAPTGNPVIWTAPSTDGTYTISLELNDGTNTITGDINIIVSNENIIYYPEIDILAGTTDILYGTGSFDFGDLGLELPASEIMFTIENNGLKVLNLLGTPLVDINGANAGCFNVEIEPFSVIPSSDYTTFILSFTPDTMGSKTASITIMNDDPDESVYTFNVTGTGVINPNIIVTGTTPTFDITPTWNWNIPAGAVNIRYSLDNAPWTVIGNISVTSFTPGTPLLRGIHTLSLEADDGSGTWLSTGSFSIDIGQETPADITASNNLEDRIRITWSSVTDASVYYIYRSTQLNGTYTEIGNTVTTAYDDLNVGNDDYYYKIRAKTINDVYSDYSTIDIGRINVPGTCIILPRLMTVQNGDNFVTDVYVNTGTDTLSAYGFEFFFDPEILLVDAAIGLNGVTIGADGFITAATINASSLMTTGFDISGEGPSNNLHFLSIHWKTVGIGTTAIDFDVQTLVNPLAMNIGNYIGAGAFITVE